MAKILLVEDDLNLSTSIQQYLSNEHVVDVVNDGAAALDFLSSYEYDLIILDRQLPSLDGTSICREFRKRGGSTPIIMLTGLSSIDNKEEGFDAGADDYLAKPFDFRELIPRIRAMLRRAPQYVGDIIRARDIALDTKLRTVHRGDEEIRLQPSEYALLEFFMKHPNQLVTADSLLTRLWSAEAEASLDSLYACLAKVRKKINPDDKEYLIRTEKGFGYRLVP